MTEYVVRNTHPMFILIGVQALMAPAALKIDLEDADDADEALM